MAGDITATAKPEFVEKLRTQLVQKAEQAKAIVELAESQDRDLTEQEMEQAEALTLQAEGLKAKMQRAQERGGKFGIPAADLETLFAGGAGGQASRAKRGEAWGRKVVEACSDGLKFKGLTSSGTVLVAIPSPEPIALGRPVTSLRSMIHNESTDGYFAFLRQTTRTSNAAPVAPGALKPTSIYTFERVQDYARTIAHLSEPIPRQDLSDAPLLQDFIATEMAWALEMELEDQLLNGDGVGENLLGLANTPGILTVTRPDATGIGLITGLRRAITSLEANGLQGTGWIMSPADWQNVELTATTDGALVLNSAGQAVPIDSAARRLFGLPVAVSVSCAPGTAYLGDWVGSTILYEREGATLSWSENTWDPDALGAGQGASDFSRNLVRFRSEGRWGLGVTRPSGVVKISLV